MDRQRFREFLEDYYEIIRMVITLSVGIVVLVLFLVDHFMEAKRKRSLSYDEQVESLNKVEASLKELVYFVELQKNRLTETNNILHQLKEEELKLKPVIEANRKVIDAIFTLQAEQSTKSIWKERGFGFVLGILSSMIASVLLGMLRRTIANKKNKINNQTMHLNLQRTQKRGSIE